MSREKDFDVVVAGAGGAGTVAALAAAEVGLSVLLIDESPGFRRGCNTYLSTSMIPAAGTRLQRRAGIEDSPEIFLADIMRKTKGTANEALSQSLTTVSAELVHWLVDSLGLPLELATDFTYPGHSCLRCHTLPERSGHALHGHLMAKVESTASITVAFPIAVRSVELDGDGAVSAVELGAPGGSSELVNTGSVVLATGGFGANHDLVEAFLPEIAKALYFGSDGCTGHALRIGHSLGADTGYLDAYQGHGSVALPEGIMVTWATVMHGAIIVNSAGRRFADETVGYSEFAREVIRQPGAIAWLVLDRRIDELCAPFTDYAALHSQQAIRWCEKVSAAAQLIGSDLEALVGTLGAVDAAWRGSRDPFGRTFWEAPLAPPLGIIRVTGALFHTQGGLLTDGDGRVLKDGMPIPGLFAAGGAAAGISGHGPAGYLAGNGLLAALGLGYRAGRAASIPPVELA